MFSSNPVEIIQSLGTVSIFVLLILLVFSVVSWGVIVYKWRMFQAMDRDEEEFLEDHERLHFNAKGLEILRNSTNVGSLSPSGAVFAGIAAKVDQRSDLFSNRDVFEQSRVGRWPQRQYLEKVVQYIVQEQITQQESYLSFLATTGNITPFIGLFGTVVGVMNAFREIGEQGSASIAVVAPGVAEALVATAVGLFAAIPAVVAYNYFLTRIRKSTHRVEAFSIEFLNLLDEVAHDIKVGSVVTKQGKQDSGAKIIKKPSGRTVKGRGKPAAEFALSPKPEKKHEEEVESLHPLPEIEEVSIQEAQPAVAETEANKEIARFSPEVAAVTEVLGDSLPTLEDLLQQGASAESVPATDETKTSTAKRKTPKEENKGEVIR
jgi:biopolymer transport protein TolQ